MFDLPEMVDSKGHPRLDNGTSTTGKIVSAKAIFCLRYKYTKQFRYNEMRVKYSNANYFARGITQAAGVRFDKNRKHI